MLIDLWFLCWQFRERLTLRVDPLQPHAPPTRARGRFGNLDPVSFRINSVRDQLKILITPLIQRETNTTNTFLLLALVCISWMTSSGLLQSEKKNNPIMPLILSSVVLLNIIALLDRNKTSYSLNPPPGSPDQRRQPHCPGGSFVSGTPNPSRLHPAITMEYVNISMELQ